LPFAELLDLDLLAAAFAALIGGWVLGFTGFGAALVMTPAFTLLWGATVAVPTCLILLVIANAQLFLPAVRACEPRTTAVLSAAACLTIPLGSYLLLAVERTLMQRAIRMVVLLLTLALAAGFRYRGARTAPLSAGIGAVSGVLNGATGMGGPPVILYLLAGDDPAARIRATLLAYYAVVNTLSLVALAIAGLVTGPVLVRALVMAPLYMIGIWVGARFFQRGGQDAYRRWALAILFAIAVATLVA
jgi:uncharacterized membrane protein YfcA